MTWRSAHSAERVVLLLVLLAAGATVTHQGVVRWQRHTCAARASDVRTTLAAAFVAQEAHRGEWDRYAGTLDALGMSFPPGGRYHHSLARVGDGFVFVAVGRPGSIVAGDTWRIGSDGRAVHVVDACARWEADGW